MHWLIGAMETICFLRVFLNRSVVFVAVTSASAHVSRSRRSLDTGAEELLFVDDADEAQDGNVRPASSSIMLDSSDLPVSASSLTSYRLAPSQYDTNLRPLLERLSRYVHAMHIRNRQERA